MAIAARPENSGRYGLFLGGRWVETAGWLPVRNKYTQEIIGWVGEAGPAEVDRAVTAAGDAARRPAGGPRERARWLARAAALVRGRREQFAGTIAAEAGKPIRDARAEVDRAVETLTISGEEAKRIAGHEIPVAAAPGAGNRLGFTMRLPLGTVCAITPFNYPLNLACHKIAPALAAGNTVVWKPASATPLTAVLLTRVLEEAGVPPGFLNLVCGGGPAVGEALLNDPRLDFYTFTGSLKVGRHIRRTIGVRRATLELGSNCGVIVHRDADLDLAVTRCAAGAFGYAGQNCDGVQRVYVHRDLYPAFRDRLVKAARALRLGDPLLETTDVGPLITEEAAGRVAGWVDAAVAAGATLLTGGIRKGNVFPPTVLENVGADQALVREEVFAPVVGLFPYSEVNEAVALVNDTRFGLQAGLFTRDLDVAWQVARQVRVGGVMVNESSCYRVDLMPFGGARESGAGREGPRYAIEEMSELRLVVFNL